MKYLVVTLCLVLVGCTLIGSIDAPKSMSFVDGPYPQRVCKVEKDITGSWQNMATCDDGETIYLSKAQIERLVNRR